MGYDDNTPLKGVTGGGLPAEIWHEVMVRVHEGLPPTPLPMDTPEPKLAPNGGYASSPNTLQDGQSPAGGPQVTQPAAQDTDLAEQIIREVLGTLGN
jgi:penicillin-binding protein 1A